MLQHDLLLVTFPVDLGNRTIESNLQSIFSEDMDFYRFAERHANEIDSKRISVKRSLIYRFQSAIALRKVVGKYTREGKSIVFSGLSPALFSLGLWKPDKTAIMLDWTRSLYPAVLGQPIRRDIAFFLHRYILNRCQKILFSTDSLYINLSEIYQVHESSLFKVPIPFLVEDLNIPPRITPNKPRVLFVGGDLERKGGDVLLKSWQQFLRDKCTLTMMTNDNSANVEGVQFLPGVKYGSEIHKRTFEEHDILVLPTKIDSYPQVIGEAAAAGLVVITTQYALASKEVIIDQVTGYITDTTEDCIVKLESLLSKPHLIDEFKQKGYKLMHQKFARQIIRNSYLDIFKNIL